MLTTLRVLAGVAWLFPLLVLAPRALRGSMRDLLDWSISLLFVLFIAHWLIMPNDDISFVLLYALSIVVAACLGWMAWHDRNP